MPVLSWSAWYKWQVIFCGQRGIVAGGLGFFVCLFTFELWLPTQPMLAVTLTMYQAGLEIELMFLLQTQVLS